MNILYYKIDMETDEFYLTGKFDICQIYPKSWDYFTSQNNINQLFSKYGINNYTQRKKYPKDLYLQPQIDPNIEFGFVTKKKQYGKNENGKPGNGKNENIEFPNKRRMVTSTPFTEPSVISYGLIVFAKDTGRCVVVQDRHTTEFLLIFRGFFRKTFTKFLLSKLTIDESEMIIKCLNNDTETFINIYLNDLKLDEDSLLYALVRMADSRNDILKIIKELNVINNSLPWNWPKGRTRISWMKEGALECAKREFLEEVEITLPAPLNISKTYISDQITTVTGRNIESRYWIYIIPNEIPLSTPTSNPEVINRKWVDIETCSQIIPQTSTYRTLFDEILNK